MEGVERARVPRRGQQAVPGEVLLLLADGHEQVDRDLAGRRRRVLRQRLHQVPHKQLQTQSSSSQGQHVQPPSG